MKYFKIILITFLLTNSALANIRVDVSGSVGSCKNGCSAQFETQEKADKWIQDNLKNDSFGKGERWVENEEGLECLELKDQVSEDVNGDIVTKELCKLAKQYSITQTDISEEVAANKAKKEKDAQDIESIRQKLVDGSAKLEDLLLWVKIREGL